MLRLKSATVVLVMLLMGTMMSTEANAGYDEGDFPVGATKNPVYSVSDGPFSGVSAGTVGYEEIC